MRISRGALSLYGEDDYQIDFSRRDASFGEYENDSDFCSPIQVNKFYRLCEGRV